MIELKKLIEDGSFVEAMNQAFADLRADYELDLDTRREKIIELESIHVDLDGHLADLSNLSTNSSGIVSGLRGTGKTHLFLLARNKILNTIHERRTFCLYLNVKRLHVPEEFTQEIFNRVFCIFLYSELSKQLYSYLESLIEDKLWDKFLQLFDRNHSEVSQALEDAILKIALFQSIVQIGSQKISNLSVGKEGHSISEKELSELNANLSAKLSATGSVGAGISAKIVEEVSKLSSSDNTYLNYLNLDDICIFQSKSPQVFQFKSGQFYQS